jgi:hypothetical protein
MPTTFRSEYSIGDTVWYVNERTEIVKSCVSEITFRGRHPNNISYRLDNAEVWQEQYLFGSREAILFRLKRESPEAPPGAL